MKSIFKLKKLSIPILVLSALACTENRFTTIVDIDVADHEPQLTLSSRIIAPDIDDSYPWNHIVVVGKSQGINSENVITEIPGALVTLLENGQFVDTGKEIKVKIRNFNPRRDSAIVYQLSFRDYKPGNSYQLTVEKAGFVRIWANQPFYDADSISEMEYLKDGGHTTDGNIEDIINLSLSQFASEKYYLVEGEYLFKNRGSDSIANPDKIVDVTLGSEDPLLEKAVGGGLILRGRDFYQQGKKIRVNIRGNYQSDFSEGSRFKMRLHTMSKDQYFYFLSNQQYDDSNANPFAEPVEVYSNVENGFGIFSIESITSKTILLK